VRKLREIGNAEALVLHGREATVDEVLAEVEKDRPFYDNSGGGMTLSGGEPLMQADFCEALLRAAHERGLHCALDTCGFVPWERFERVLPYVDLVLYDVKSVDPEEHRRATAQDNELILGNLRRLASTGVAIQVRVPVVPGHNASVEAADAIARMLSDLPNPPPVELLKYHRLGEGKYETLGLVCPEVITDPPSDGQMQELREAVEKYGLRCAVGG